LWLRNGRVRVGLSKLSNARVNHKFNKSYTKVIKCLRSSPPPSFRESQNRAVLAQHWCQKWDPETSQGRLGELEICNERSGSVRGNIAAKQQSESPIQSERTPGRTASKQISNATRDDADLPHDDSPAPSSTRDYDDAFCAVNISP